MTLDGEKHVGFRVIITGQVVIIWIRLDRQCSPQQTETRDHDYKTEGDYMRLLGCDRFEIRLDLQTPPLYQSWPIPLT